MKVSQSCPTLCNSMDYTVHGILLARILEGVAFPFSRGSSQPRNRTHVSCIAGRFFTEVSYKGSLTVSQGKGSISPERRRDPKMWTEPCDRSRENDTNHLHCHLPAVYFQSKPAAAKSLQSCPTLCDPIDGSPPGSPVPGILQARTLEWVTISFSNA